MNRPSSPSPGKLLTWVFIALLVALAASCAIDTVEATLNLASRVQTLHSVPTGQPDGGFPQ